MKFLRFLLFPFAIIYDAVTTIRNLFFDVGIFKQTSFKTPIIVVGNLSVGGTGKTPQIEYLIRLLKGTFKVSVLSRGYKRKTNGYVLLNDNHTALDVGDEPLQYYKKFTDIDVAVVANRVEGAQNLVQQKSPAVILLDDAYQHRKIKGSFYILLTKFNDLFTDDFLLPTGNLRESRSGAERADVIIVTKCPKNLNFTEQESIKKKLNKYHKEVFFTTISYGEIKSKQSLISVDDLKNHQVLLITGIANPNPLLNYLDDNKINYNHLKYADHHHFSSEEIREINIKFDALTSNKKIILTTEKDYIRLSEELKNLYYIEIETRFLGNQKEGFNQKIIDHIQ
ncbi:tetraacyldisaccharide 4'-kinase [Polaribacter vadi]|uniref:tetraacyldisaccharide 4'-kinase n=1 Tax=Polaribacter TaxID=52959 RepID=UPI001C08A58A|nr:MULTISPECIES: tetraacyldisaccharide 4'-kinase [Polaribacter]MBU3012981.1 tetraacyldisaccharide 4'-kinase [Polaribacter vadi]MDO6742799.1 tetraacyldisaccharide 4'-kinase [Polaribacter sp. 1_MG-2023]